MWAFLTAACFLKICNPRRQSGDSDSKMEAELLGNQIMEGTFHHLGCILLVKSRSQTLPTLKERGLLRGVNTRKPA